GRQMPASSIEATNASNSRAFDFANLASESVSAVEVYKTSRAATPTGGIGAAINIRTARPLDTGTLASVGLKAVHDGSVGNLPGPMRGEQWTGELSGIFSETFADGRFGIALSGSYQDRDFGYNEGGVAGGWYGCRRWCDPLAAPEPAANATNPPGPDDNYSIPQNLLYAVNSVGRQRTNGQATLQWAPNDRVTATLDYTYAENRIQARRHELSTWFNQAASETEWTDGPTAPPLRYTEYAGCYNPATDQWAGRGRPAVGGPGPGRVVQRDPEREQLAGLHRGVGGQRRARPGTRLPQLERGVRRRRPVRFQQRDRHCRRRARRDQRRLQRRR